MNETIPIKDGTYDVMLILHYICHAAEDNLTFDDLYTITQQSLGHTGELILMTIADHLRKEGLEKGILLGGILFAQKIMKLTIYSQEELEEKDLDDLKRILTKMEAQLQIRE